MIPSKAIWEAQQNLLAADATTLGNSTAMKVALVISAFVPSQLLDLATVTLATFTGSTPLSAGTGTQQVFYDALTGQRVIQVKEPAGGWTWLCTATPGSPETVYGLVLTDNAGTVLYGSMLLPAPQTVSAAGQGVTVANMRFSFLSGSPQ